MELQGLRYFVALSEELNFTRAAARCWVSQQAFSRAIAQIEQRFGTALVVRRTRGCSLTSSGVRLAEAARDLIERADMLDIVVGRPDSALRLGFVLDGLGAATPLLIAACRAALPGTEVRPVRLQPHETTTALITGRVDIAFTHGPTRDVRLVEVPLFTEPRVAILSRADARADAASLDADDLLELPARPRRADIDVDWESFFMLVHERAGEQPPRSGDPVSSFEELLWGISTDGVFLTAPSHLELTYPGEVYGVAFVPTPTLARVPFTAVHTAAPRHPLLDDVLAVALAVTASSRPPDPLAALA